MIYYLLIPFIGTTLGSLMVCLLKKNINQTINIILSATTSGIMLAASFFSLLIPSLELNQIISSSIGFLCGMILFLIFDIINSSDEKFYYAITIHNIPEGMALGVMIASLFSGNNLVSVGTVLALSIGIGIQNFPEGAIISMPLYAKGKSKLEAFWLGLFSGIVELLSGVISFFLASFVSSILAFSLAFAAAAMIYVIITELSIKSQNKKIAILSFSIGFLIMMILDNLL